MGRGERGRSLSTDITKGPRVCPSCGRENALTASHCSFCFASLNQGVQTTPSPPPAALTEPSPFHRFDKAPLWNPGYTGAFLILICIFFGIVTCGFGLLLFIPLAPTLYRLHRADQHVSADYDSPDAGCAALCAGAALALLVAASAVITFCAVFYSIVETGFNLYRTEIDLVLGTVLGTLFGLLASGAVAYLLVRAIFPPYGPRNRGGPRPALSDED
jgi:hypothetical protein